VDVYTLDDVLGRGFDARQLRFALVRGHYRQPLNFTWQIMAEVASALEGLDELVARLQHAARVEPDAAREGTDLVAEARQAFESAMDDDLNVPRALAALFGLRSAVLEGRVGPFAAREALAFLERVDGVLGVLRFEAPSIDAEVEALIAGREQARTAKDWGRADEIRARLAELGVELQDTPEGVVWRRR
jgi:cysteinyl-tRNA synthetase